MKLEKYNKIVEKNSQKEDKTKNVFLAFLSGGVLGVIGEIFVKLLEEFFYMPTHEAYMYLMIFLVIISSILTGLGIFDKLVSYFKCGLNVPTTGFAHSMTSSAMDNRSEGPIKGIGTNIFKMTGIIILYGVVSAFILALIKGVML